MFHSGTIKWWDHLWQDAGIFQSIASSLLNDFDRNIILAENRHEVFSHQSFFTLANMTLDSEGRNNFNVRSKTIFSANV